MGEEVPSGFSEGHAGPALLLKAGPVGLDQVVQPAVHSDDEAVLALAVGLGEGFGVLHGPCLSVAGLSGFEGSSGELIGRVARFSVAVGDGFEHLGVSQRDLPGHSGQLAAARGLDEHGHFRGGQGWSFQKGLSRIHSAASFSDANSLALARK